MHLSSWKSTYNSPVHVFHIKQTAIIEAQLFGIPCPNLYNLEMLKSFSKNLNSTIPDFFFFSLFFEAKRIFMLPP